ncbi:MAG: CopG family antitoxin [Xenococcaceae cyanobacterium]
MTTNKKVPDFETDEELEEFLEQDLTSYMDDIKSWEKVQFVFDKPHLSDLPKDKSVTMRWPEALLDKVKEKAETQGINYQKYIRRVVEASLRQVPK